MPELTREQFAAVAPLLPPGHGMARAVLTGNARGRVWADDEHAPTRALIATIEVWILVGAPADDGFEQDLERIIEQVVMPGNAVHADHDEVALTFPDPAWEPRLMGLFGGRDLLSDPRRYYEVEASRLRPAALPEGYDLVDVDAEFLGAETEVRVWIEGHYRDHATFLERAVATVLTSQGEPVCWCVTDCVEGGVAEVGINTVEAHRRRGLAAAAVTATCERLFARGVQRIGWHCYAINEGSVRTAQRCGFELVRDYPCRFRMFDPVRHELVRGYCLLEIEGDAAAAAAHLSAVLAEHPESDASWFELAERAAQAAARTEP